MRQKVMMDDRTAALPPEPPAGLQRQWGVAYDHPDPRRAGKRTGTGCYYSRKRAEALAIIIMDKGRTNVRLVARDADWRAMANVFPAPQ